MPYNSKEKRKTGVVHLREDYFQTACGYVWRSMKTDDAQKVTCGNCQRTGLYKLAAETQRWAND